MFYACKMFVHLAVQRILIFFGIAVTTSRTHSNWPEKNIVEYYYSFCPYNNFCNKNATNIRNSNEMHLTSCCQECSCDPDCQIFGVCCPDYTLVDDIDVKYPCVDLDSYFNIPRGIFISYFDLIYHIIDDCRKPVAYSTHCENSTLLEDFIFVTDIKTGHIYKNKHCALCHGVDEYEEWGILTICKAIEKLSFDTFEQRDKYVVKHCPIIPNPPPSQKTSLYRCIQIDPLFGFIEECKHADDIREVDKSLVNACERHSPYTNDRIRVGEIWYKNIYCFQCSNELSTYSYLCEKPKVNYPRPVMVLDTLVLNTKVQRSSEKPERCNASSILDPYTDTCLQLYCEPGSIPSFSKCVSVSDKSSGIYIAMVFSVELNVSVENYNYIFQLVGNFETIMTAKVGDKISCDKGYVWRGMKSRDVYLIYAIVTEANCSRDFLISYLWKLCNDSITIVFTHSNATIKAKLTASIESHEVIKVYRHLDLTSRHAWYNVLRSCARIDKRMVPMLTRLNSDTWFLGNVIDNKVCIQDYFDYAELTNNATRALKQYFFVLIFNTLLFCTLK